MDLLAVPSLGLTFNPSPAPVSRGGNAQLVFPPGRGWGAQNVGTALGRAVSSELFCISQPGS